MKVIDPGHEYELFVLDRVRSNEVETLGFVKRDGPGYPGNVGHHSGTNIQDVIRVLIDRVKYLDNQIHCRENGMVLHALRDAIWWLELRASSRHGRFNLFDVVGLGHDIEEHPFCPMCGHIGCNGNCKNSS